jgi:hypothetical protein
MNSSQILVLLLIVLVVVIAAPRIYVEPWCTTAHCLRNC